MKTCETCKHWEETGSLPQIVRPTEGVCDFISDTNEFNEPFNKIRAEFSGVWTGKNFGCIHHEGK
jgi:hypothetical protein